MRELLARDERLAKAVAVASGMVWIFVILGVLSFSSGSDASSLSSTGTGPPDCDTLPHLITTAASACTNPLIPAGDWTDCAG